MDDLPWEGRAGSSLGEEMTQRKIRVRPASTPHADPESVCCNFRHEWLAVTGFRSRNPSPHSLLFTSNAVSLTLLLELSR
jgi:hypothetical protein